MMEMRFLVIVLKIVKTVAPSTGKSHLKHAPNNQFKWKHVSLESLATTQSKARLVHTLPHRPQQQMVKLCNCKG